MGTAALGCPAEQRLGSFFAGVTSVAEQFAEKLDYCSVLKVRGFSRAVSATKSVLLLATEVTSLCEVFFSKLIKPLSRRAPQAKDSAA